MHEIKVEKVESPMPKKRIVEVGTDQTRKSRAINSIDRLNSDEKQLEEDDVVPNLLE